MKFKEKALFLQNNVQELNLTGFSNIYLGDEFCERLLPSIDELKNAINLCEHNKLKLTLVTPYLTDKGIDTLIQRVDFIIQKELEYEIVINDWGALSVLQNYYPDIRLVLGRILVSQYLSGYHAKFSGYESSLTNKKMNSHCNFPGSFISFLRENNISSLEFNRYQHLAATQEQLKEFGFFSHIYYPFEYLTTSRYCAYVKSFPSYMHSATQNCYKDCKKYIAVKKSKLVGRDVIIKGNTHFIKETKDLSQLNCAIDRIIYNDFLSFPHQSESEIIE